jgi:phosphohistidine phosphatase
MKTALLLRHAKSSWDDSTLDDHNRPLAPRGARAADRMGRYFAASNLRPDLVLCSSARRALETLEGLRTHFEDELRIETEPRIYGASPAELLELLRALDDAVRAALLIGHEPSISQLACGLIRPDGSSAIQKMERKFPTAALAEVCFDAEHWRDIELENGMLRQFVRPRDLD